MHRVSNLVSQRINDVPPSGIQRFFDIAATMENVISLGIGELGFDPPEPINGDSDIAVFSCKRTPFVHSAPYTTT